MSFGTVCQRVNGWKVFVRDYIMFLCTLVYYAVFLSVGKLLHLADRRFGTGYVESMIRYVESIDRG